MFRYEIDNVYLCAIGFLRPSCGIVTTLQHPSRCCFTWPSSFHLQHTFGNPSYFKMILLGHFFGISNPSIKTFSKMSHSARKRIITNQNRLNFSQSGRNHSRHAKASNDKSCSIIHAARIEPSAKPNTNHMLSDTQGAEHQNAYPSPVSEPHLGQLETEEGFDDNDNEIYITRADWLWAEADDGKGNDGSLLRILERKHLCRRQSQLVVCEMTKTIVHYALHLYLVSKVHLPTLRSTIIYGMQTFIKTYINKESILEKITVLKRAVCAVQRTCQCIATDVGPPSNLSASDNKKWKTRVASILFVVTKQMSTDTLGPDELQAFVDLSTIMINKSQGPISGNSTRFIWCCFLPISCLQLFGQG